MEEEMKTPEQEEMEVYEKYIEKFGAEAVFAQIAEATRVASTSFAMGLRFVRRKDEEAAAMVSEAVKVPLRCAVAGLQVYLNMMELLIGDTAEEECAVIQFLSEEIYAAEDIH